MSVKVRIALAILVVILTPALTGCPKDTSSSPSVKQDYLSRVAILKNLPEINLDDQTSAKRGANTIAARLDLATALSPPPGLADYHEQLLNTLRLYGEAYQLIYQADGADPSGQKIEAVKKRFDASIELDILNNWFPGKSARPVDGERYYNAVKSIFIDEQQPANVAFNQYVNSGSATNNGISKRLSGANKMLEKERLQLRSLSPPASLASTQRDFLRVLLLDERANDLYAEELGADNVSAVNSFSRLSNDFSSAAGDLLAKSLQQLSVKTHHRNRWQLN